MRVAVTRPRPDGERAAAALRARGHDVLLVPLLGIEPVAADLSGEWSAIAMTSANAAGAAGASPHLLHLPVFAVGRHTAEAARAAGFRDVTAADGDSRELAGLIARKGGGPRAPLLYLAGADRAFQLERELRERGIAANTAVVYRATMLPYPTALTEALAKGTLAAVLHFSARSAQGYLAGAAAAGIAVERALAPQHLCLSAQIAAVLQAAGAPDLRVAAKPEEAALLDLVESR
jgi:uroporphyrinogen-III synthase